MKRKEYNEMKSADDQSHQFNVKSNLPKDLAKESDQDLQLSHREHGDYSSRAPILPSTPVLAKDVEKAPLPEV